MTDRITRRCCACWGPVDDWLSRIDPGAERQRPAPGSPLRGDDDRTHPYETSHAAWHALSHAVDHLHCLRSLLRDAQVIHMYAPTRWYVPR